MWLLLHPQWGPQFVGLLPGAQVGVDLGWSVTAEPCSVGLVLGQALEKSRPITRSKNECGSHQVSGRAPARSLGGSLDRQDGPWTVAEKDWN